MTSIHVRERTSTLCVSYVDPESGATLSMLKAGPAKMVRARLAPRSTALSKRPELQRQSDAALRACKDRSAALCDLSNADVLRRAWTASLGLWSVEGTMANQAKEARARLEASFRKQHEAERAAAKGRAEHDTAARDTSVDRDRDTPQPGSGSVGQKGGRQGDWS